MPGTNKVAAGSLDWKASLSDLFNTSVGLASNYYGTKLAQELRPEQPIQASIENKPDNKMVIYVVVGVALFFAYQYTK